MKKNFYISLIFILLSSCAESVALLGPATTSVGGGTPAQSALTTAFSYGVKKQTGKSPMEHAYSYIEKNNPKKEKIKCVAFLESTNSELCAAIQKNIIQTKKKIVEKSKIKFLNSKE